MPFIFLLLEVAATAIVSAVANRVANDLYDKTKHKKN